MNTRKRLAIIFGTPIFIALVLVWLYHEKAQDQFNTEDKSNLIRVSSPLPEEVVESPLIIKGEARGYWYFEGDFPAILFDENNKQIAVLAIQTQNDWMTKDFVPFYAEMTFKKPKTNKGILVLKKDNPSDLAELDDELRIPVKFK